MPTEMAAVVQQGIVLTIREIEIQLSSGKRHCDAGKENSASSESHCVRCRKFLLSSGFNPFNDSDL